MRLGRAVRAYGRAGALVAGAVLTVVGPAAARAQAVRGSRVELQGGGSLPVGHANYLLGNDDLSTGAQDIGFQLNFFGLTHTQLYVNNNGNVTFGSGTYVYTPQGLSGNLREITDNPDVTGIIAPFFGDVDTRSVRSRTFVDGSGNVISRPQTVGYTSWGAYSASDPFGVLVGGHDVFSVTWSDVGFFSQRTVGTNTFQLNLINRDDTGAGNFDIEFDYDGIQWEAGQASGSNASGLGGESAHVGFSAGTGTAGSYLELAGSGVNGAFLDGGPDALIASSLGSDVLGRYVFQVRNSVAGTPGESQQNPQLPSIINPGDPSAGVGPTYGFRGLRDGMWVDPPDTYGFQFSGLNNTLFTGVGLPTGYSPFDICWGAGFASCATGVGSGTFFDFVNAANGPGGSIGAFRILGIDPLVDSANPNGFPTQLFFTGPGDVDMTALLVPTTATPEPATLVLLGAGLVGLAAVRRRTRSA